MSKTIRLEDAVYAELEALREKRMTFSEAVAKLIKVFHKMQALVEVTQGVPEYQAYKAAQRSPQGE